MFRNWLSSAWGDLIRSPVQSLIAVGGLAIGLTAAILAGAVVVNQISYDHFIDGYQNTYFATLEYMSNDEPLQYFAATPHDLAGRLKADFPEIEAVTRLAPRRHSLRHGGVEALEMLYEADPNAWQVLRIATIDGNFSLERPDTIVIPKSIALKYFGRTNVAGETLELDRQRPLKIAAVIQDLPQNETNLASGIFLSDRSAFADLFNMASMPPNGPATDSFIVDVRTLVRLKPGAQLAKLQTRFLAMSQTLLPRPSYIKANLYLVPIGQLHMSDHLFPEVRQRLAIIIFAALLILFLACVNFINLTNTRSMRRGVEVAIRKTAGANRTNLIVQFLGEANLQVLLALCLALMAVEWLLPYVDNFLNAGADLGYWNHPSLILGLVFGALVIGTLAGVYPAMIASAFRPVVVIGGLLRDSKRRGLVRDLLVALQFAILVGLIIAAAAASQEYRFVVRDAVHLDTDQMMIVRANTCESAFKTAVESLPGVRGVACSNPSLLQEANYYGPSRLADGTRVDVLRMIIGPDLLELYGLKPLAGRFFVAHREGDAIPATRPANFEARFVLNETAVRKLEYPSPEAAIGKKVTIIPYNGVVIGVVKDFWIYSGRRKVDPIVYYVNDGVLNPLPSNTSSIVLHIKLDSKQIPATLSAIDKLWDRSAPSGPIQRTFMNAYIENLWLPLLREGQAFLIFAGVGVLLACLGLFSISLFVTQRHIKEIGIRKAMGARNRDVVSLLLWQFAKPVLWANLVAWPITFWALDRWLSHFPYHVDLPLWLFPAAGSLTMIIALFTVLGQVVLIARQKPVLALRYE